MAMEGADQAKGLPLVGGGVGAGAAGDAGEVVPAAGLGASEALACGVGEQVPLYWVPHLVGHVHSQGLRSVVLEVPGGLQMLVGAAFQRFTGEAEALPYGLRSVAVAFVFSRPVGIGLGAGVALYGPLDAPHRPEQLVQPGQVAGFGDGQRQHHHRHHPVVGLLPLRSLVLPPELPCRPGSLHDRHLPS
ncbi:hypothetical protein ACQKM2_16925 [Streptomyces sp. NPDC004126]|uniref:hypothetical protein n=1 Tax=Streptomyces sp. NPDC004126 TaxID=3390695 RepID=UPI003CFE259D